MFAKRLLDSKTQNRVQLLGTEIFTPQLEVYPQCVFCKIYRMNCPHPNSLMMEGARPVIHSSQGKFTQRFFFKDCVAPDLLPAKVLRNMELNGVYISF